METHPDLEARSLPKEQESVCIPRHIGVIMDGNGRWAALKGVSRLEGHRQGMEAARKAVSAALEWGVDYLTLYAFSAENWCRPREEIFHLMGLLKKFVHVDLQKLHAHHVRIRFIGAREGLSKDLCALLQKAEETTQHNQALNLVIAFNYGSRQELTAAFQTLAQQVVSGTLKPQDITPERISSALDTHGIPDPDLIIRTSGEQRLSNFLLWQSAYAELVFLPLHWPDFNDLAFEEALQIFSQRCRRFGGRGSRSFLVPSEDQKKERYG